MEQKVGDFFVFINARANGNIFRVKKIRHLLQEHFFNTLYGLNPPLPTSILQIILTPPLQFFLNFESIIQSNVSRTAHPS